MQRPLLSALGVLALASSAGADQAPGIEHQPVQCVVAERYPRLDARFAPPDAVAKARVLFQARDGRHWYAVAMKREGSGFSGVLPKPKKSLDEFRYYIEVVNKAADVGRTEEYRARVVRTPGECQEKIVASGLGSASVTVEVPAGAPSVPPGFNSGGLAVAGSAGAAGAVGVASGATATAGVAAGAAAGGGIPTAVVIGGVAAAAGVAVAVKAKNSDGDSNASSAAAGTYVLASLDGAALPTVVVTTPCIGSAVSGTLRLDRNPPNYELTETTSFQCLNGPGPTNPHTESGRWSENGSVISFASNGASIFGLSTGTLSGATLTLAMDILSEAQGVPPRRYQSVWTKR